ncbi:MAG: sulfite exporter TauE/SafE family protein [Bacteroidota bacterium]|jgi:hypothetical protein
MEIFLIAVVAAAASFLTLFSGFGLGTILTPFFLFFFPVEIAVALTGVVHLFNNLFKFALLGKQTQWGIVLRFGIPSILGAFLGAKLLLSLSVFEPLARYSIGGRILYLEPLNIVIAFLMIYFALAEMFPKLQAFTPSKRALPAGGLISGFFGGLSGHQGALRAAFLIRYNLTKEQFLATGIVIACLVDLTRLSIYSSQFVRSHAVLHWDFLVAAILSAFAGAYAGNKLLKKVTLSIVQKIVAALLLLIALGLGSGLL